MGKKKKEKKKKQKVVRKREKKEREEETKVERMRRLGQDLYWLDPDFYFGSEVG